MIYTSIRMINTKRVIELKKLGKNVSRSELANACGSMETIWEELFPAERYKLAHQLIDKITLYTDRIIMDIKPCFFQWRGFYFRPGGVNHFCKKVNVIL